MPSAGEVDEQAVEARSSSVAGSNTPAMSAVGFGASASTTPRSSARTLSLAVAPSWRSSSVCTARLRQRHRGDEVGHHLDRAQRHLRRVDGVDRGGERAVARHQREAAAVERPARAEAMRVVDREADRDAAADRPARGRR